MVLGVGTVGDARSRCRGVVALAGGGLAPLPPTRNGMREREVSGRKVVFEISTKILSLRYLSLFLYALYGTLSTSLRCTRLLLVELLLQPLGDELLGELVRVTVRVRVS